MTQHLQNLSSQFRVSLPLDEKGFIGRECPNTNCNRYFKIKPGTGLKGNDLPCHCPYCGHKGPMNHFNTKSQIEYATSVVKDKVKKAIANDLKDIAKCFNRRMRGGLLSMKLDVKSSPSSLRYYSEHELETDIECKNCSLQYSVYGIFAFCPDCGQHNSFQILNKNLELVGKMLDLADVVETELTEKFIENAMEDCVSAFDGFGRELCRLHVDKTSSQLKVEKFSFQNLEGAKTNVLDIFGIDLSADVSPDEWRTAVIGFQKRHLISHKMGVVDQNYINKTGDKQAIVGRKVGVSVDEIRHLAQIICKIALYLSDSLQKL